MDTIECYIAGSGGKFNGVINRAIKKKVVPEDFPKIKEDLHSPERRPFSVFTSEDLKSQHILKDFVLHGKRVPKMYIFFLIQ